MPSAEIITIGTEILLGEIVDTNTRFLARNLRGLGVDLFRTVTIGDNRARIAETIRAAMQRADIVITTGGLGPTVDDPTREAVADAAGVETEFRPELWEQVKAVVARYGRVAAENQKKQACVPRGALAIENPVGTAPAFIVEFPRVESHREDTMNAKGDELREELNSTSRPHLHCTERSAVQVSSLRSEKGGAIISLPGVPREMEYLFHHAVVPYLQKKFSLRDLIKVRLLHVAGMSESAIDEQVAEFELLANPTVGLAAHTGVVDIRIAAKAESEEQADRMIAEIETVVRTRLGDAIFGADDDTLEAATLRSAASRGWNVVMLESGLDGSLARRFAANRPANLAALEEADLRPGELPERTRQARERRAASVALGVALRQSSENEQVIELQFDSAEGSQSRRLTYGGHPKSAPRWAGNLALNWLRQIANGKR